MRTAITARIALFASLLALSGLAAGIANAQLSSNCGDLTNAYGPFDYRRERNRALRIVEVHHFTTEVELLQRSKAGYLGSDLDYTLRASPNHHRALASLANFGLREKSSQPPHTRYTVDCYFERGARLAPDDVLVPMLYANYLIRANRIDDARTQLNHAVRLAGDNPLTHYNLGVLFLESKDLESASRHAQLAKDLGNPRTELLDRLRAANATESAKP